MLKFIHCGLGIIVNWGGVNFRRPLINQLIWAALEKSGLASLNPNTAISKQTPDVLVRELMQVSFILI